MYEAKNRLLEGEVAALKTELDKRRQSGTQKEKVKRKCFPIRMYVNLLFLPIIINFQVTLGQRQEVESDRVDSAYVLKLVEENRRLREALSNSSGSFLQNRPLQPSNPPLSYLHPFPPPSGCPGGFSRVKGASRSCEDIRHAVQESHRHLVMHNSCLKNQVSLNVC